MKTTLLNKKETQLLQSDFTAIHDTFRESLKARASYKVQSQELTEDLVQTTFLKTWKYLVNGGKIELMRAFLFHVLNGLIVDEYRKHKSTSLDTLIENGFEPGTHDTERQFNVFDGKTAANLISQLPRKYQKVMRMRYLEDLSLKEMSLITGQSKNTMAVQAHRGLEKLKELYEKNTELTKKKLSIK